MQVNWDFAGCWTADDGSYFSIPLSPKGTRGATAPIAPQLSYATHSLWCQRLRGPTITLTIAKGFPLWHSGVTCVSATPTARSTVGWLSYHKGLPCWTSQRAETRPRGIPWCFNLWVGHEANNFILWKKSWCYEIKTKASVMLLPP